MSYLKRVFASFSQKFAAVILFATMGLFYLCVDATAQDKTVKKAATKSNTTKTTATKTVAQVAPKYTTARENVICINPLALLIGYIGVDYERKLSPDNSFRAELGYWHFSDWWTAVDVGASYRWYFDPFEENKSALNGLSLGPRIEVSYWSSSYGDWYWSLNPKYKKNQTRISIGGEVSYKWVFGSGKWALEPTFKLVFPVVKEDYGFTTSSFGYGVNFGYCF